MWTLSSNHPYTVGLAISGFLIGTFLLRRRLKPGTRMDQQTGSPRLFYQDSDLLRHILKTCARLRTGVSPPWWAGNGVVQSILAAFMHCFVDFGFVRESITLADGGTIALDWGKDDDSSRVTPTSPLLIVLPGLTGGAHNMRYVCSMALQHGFRPVVFNKRGHGGSRLSTPKLQSIGDPTDLREVVELLHSRYPEVALTAVGASAGTALLVSYLGEYGAASRLSAAACVCPGFDAERLFDKFFKQPYDLLMWYSWRKLIAGHREMLSQVVDMRPVMRSRSVKDLQRELFCPLYGYDSMSEYWANNNPMRAVSNISVPTLCINSRDDPICRADNIDYDLFRDNANCLLALTDNGGHCGFFGGSKLESWADQLCVEFIESVLSYRE